MIENTRTELVHLRPRSGHHYISQSHSVLVTGRDGFIKEGTVEGLRVYQTRGISKYHYLMNGRRFHPVAVSAVRQNCWMGYYVAPPPRKSGRGLESTIELRVSRFAGHGFHEELDLTNYSKETANFRFEIEIDADFASQEEAASAKRQASGETSREWRAGDGDSRPELVFDFRAERAYEHQGESGVARFHQAIAVRIEHAPGEVVYSDGRLSWQVDLPPRGTWHACINVIPTVGEKVLEPLYPCRAFRGEGGKHDRDRNLFLSFEATQFETPESHSMSSSVLNTIRQAGRDLAAMRLYDLDQDGGWVPAAGLPEFVALFGRDTLTAAWQASLLSVAMLRGTLPALAALQAKEDSAWRDESPDKMLHQAANRLTSALEFNPFSLYYGSLTTSAVFPFAVAALWQWTGDRDLARRFVDPAMAAIHWRDTRGDLDGDGFGEYLKRSEKGLKNQGWKDSGDAIVDANGDEVEPPIAPCEEQGFLYIAKLRMAELLFSLDRKDDAARLFREASELKKRFNEAFWMEDEGYFAMGLDSNKRQIRSIASNPGHLLATAIVDDSLAQRTADRLMQDDLFSGWGVRTLSTNNPAYDPFSYQRGCVWPAENGIFALGMLRFGLWDHLERLCRGQFEVAGLFRHNRLPEAFAGHARDEDHPFPGAYPKANWPQAWSAAAVFLFLLGMLGIFPYAPLNVLFVDPHLPEWLPDITLRNLHIGQAIVDIRFWRKENGKSDYRVLDVRGKLHVVRQPSPWSLTAGLGERFEDALTSLVPGH